MGHRQTAQNGPSNDKPQRGQTRSPGRRSAAPDEPPTARNNQAPKTQIACPTSAQAARTRSTTMDVSRNSTLKSPVVVVTRFESVPVRTLNM
jgi:hypothetical protein